MEGISIIMPACNEEENLPGVVAEMAEKLQSTGSPWEIVAVNDGSTDNTGAVLEDLAQKHPSLKVITHEKNQGFGSAVTSGIRSACYDALLLVPADGQFDPKETSSFIESLQENHLTIGNRTSLKSYGLWRRLQSRTYVKLTSLFFCQNYPDVNWVQAWRKDLFDIISPVSQGVFFLQETIARTRMAGLIVGSVNSVQLPRNKGKAHGHRPGVILNTIAELFSFWWRVFKPWLDEHRKNNL